MSLHPTPKLRAQKFHNIQASYFTLHLTHRGGGKADYCCSTKIQEEGQSQAISKLDQSEHLFVQHITSSSKAPDLSSPLSSRIHGLSFLKTAVLQESCSDAQEKHFWSVAPICSPSILANVIRNCDRCIPAVSQRLWKFHLPTVAAPRPIC